MATIERVFDSPGPQPNGMHPLVRLRMVPCIALNTGLS